MENILIDVFRFYDCSSVTIKRLNQLLRHFGLGTHRLIDVYTKFLFYFPFSFIAWTRLECSWTARSKIFNIDTIWSRQEAIFPRHVKEMTRIRLDSIYKILFTSSFYVRHFSPWGKVKRLTNFSVRKQSCNPVVFERNHINTDKRLRHGFIHLCISSHVSCIIWKCGQGF